MSKNSPLKTSPSPGSIDPNQPESKAIIKKPTAGKIALLVWGIPAVLVLLAILKARVCG